MTVSASSTPSVGTAPSLALQADERGRRALERLPQRQRARLGQFFTPPKIAQFMASLVKLPEAGRVEVLDPGAGAGILTAALIDRILLERPGLELDVTAFEIEPALREGLTDTLEECVRAGGSRGSSLTYSIVTESFLEWGAEALAGFRAMIEQSEFDVVIMNPPYRKVGATSPERGAAQRIGVQVTNLYVAFLAFGAALLRPHGQLVAITPRSFASGSYFRPFRRYFFSQVALERVHVFDSRTAVFGADQVIQENVIMAGSGQASQDKVTLSRCSGDLSDISIAAVEPHEVIDPADPEVYLHIAATDGDADVAARMRAFPSTLGDLSLEVSTGRVVDFRVRDHLLAELATAAAPLVYPQHLDRSQVTWPTLRAKANALAINDATRRLLLPNETYVLVKRFTSKEEQRRVVASVYAGDLPGSSIAFENHLNVFHRDGRGLPPRLARGLAAYLNSGVVDQFIRQFNGHTQINATDLRQLRYPTMGQLSALGQSVDGSQLDQERLDDLVDRHTAS